MTGNITFTMIKPASFAAGHAGQILARFEEAGYRILALRKMKLSREQAGAFYEMHRGKPFYDELTAMMSSGPIIAAVLTKENAVESFRKFIGATDPAKAEEGTIRRIFGKSLSENAVHGSDSDESAMREAGFFFPEMERI